MIALSSHAHHFEVLINNGLYTSASEPAFWTALQTNHCLTLTNFTFLRASWSALRSVQVGEPILMFDFSVECSVKKGSSNERNK